MNGLNRNDGKSKWVDLIDSLEQQLPFALRGKKISVILILCALIYFFISVCANFLDVSIPFVDFMSVTFYKLYNWVQWSIVFFFWFLTLWIVKGVSYHLGIKNGAITGKAIGVAEGKSIGLDEGKNIGIDQGKNLGYTNGFREGYEEGERKGILKGTEEGKEEGNRTGLLDGIAKGNQQGFELGYNKALKSKIRIYEPLIENCENYLVNSLKKHNLENVGHSIIKKLTYEPQGWSEYLQYAIADYTKRLDSKHILSFEELATKMIETYFDATRKTRSENLDDPLLISNFNIYAECVTALLNTLINSKYDFGKTVIVWTLLDNPILRWYNMVNISSRNFFITKSWWEKYKNAVAKMKGNNKLQMRRLVCTRDLDFNGKHYDTNKLVIYKNATPQKIKDIESIISENPFINILPCITESIQYQEYADEEIIIIGSISQNNVNGNWMPLKKHFEQTYHSIPKSLLKDTEKGVFHGYINSTSIEQNKDLAAYLSYNDIFLIQFDEHNGEIEGFGIALKLSEKSDTDGIKLLSGHELQKTKCALQIKWNERFIEWNNKKKS